MNIKDLDILITGGTIGSEWSPQKDTAVTVATDSVTEYIKKYIDPKIKISQTIVTMKDSREITDHTREEIITAIKNCSSNNILITHGTYTMPETGRYLEKNLKDEDGIKNKKIILVGSFYPLKGYSPSDAPFNLGFAIGGFSNLKPGVYVSMHARLFKPESVKKDTEMARFYSDD